MVALSTFFASGELPLFHMVCQARRIFLSGSRAGSYSGCVGSKIDVSAYFNMLMRFALLGQLPSALGVVMVASPVFEFVTCQSMLPESSTEMMTFGRT